MYFNKRIRKYVGVVDCRYLHWKLQCGKLYLDVNSVHSCVFQFTLIIVCFFKYLNIKEDIANSHIRARGEG